MVFKLPLGDQLVTQLCIDCNKSLNTNHVSEPVTLQTLRTGDTWPLLFGLATACCACLRGSVGLSTCLVMPGELGGGEGLASSSSPSLTQATLGSGSADGDADALRLRLTGCSVFGPTTQGSSSKEPGPRTSSHSRRTGGLGATASSTVVVMVARWSRSQRLCFAPSVLFFSVHISGHILVHIDFFLKKASLKPPLSQPTGERTRGHGHGTSAAALHSQKTPHCKQ